MVKPGHDIHFIHLILSPKKEIKRAHKNRVIVITDGYAVYWQNLETAVMATVEHSSSDQPLSLKVPCDWVLIIGHHSKTEDLGVFLILQAEKNEQSIFT